MVRARMEAAGRGGGFGRSEERGERREERRGEECGEGRASRLASRGKPGVFEDDCHCIGVGELGLGRVCVGKRAAGLLGKRLRRRR